MTKERTNQCWKGCEKKNILAHYCGAGLAILERNFKLCYPSDQNVQDFDPKNPLLPIHFKKVNDNSKVHIRQMLIGTFFVIPKKKGGEKKVDSYQL